MITLDQTRQLICDLFAGVNDAGGYPYVDHCFRVEQGLDETATFDERHAALLHDVLEDTELTIHDLLSLGYNARVVYLVDMLTNKSNETYMEHMRAIADTHDEGLIKIKLSDNHDNSDPSRHACFIPEDSARRMKKYAKARAILEKGLDSK